MSIEKEQHPVSVLSAEILGLTPNHYLAHPRWAKVLIDPSLADNYWVNTWKKDSNGIRELTNDSFDDFKHWRLSQAYNQNIVHDGYIGGFPVINNTVTGDEQEYIHMWPNNTDIAVGSLTFPIKAIRAALITTRLESSLRIHSDNISADGITSERYRIPILLDTKDGKVVNILSRPAKSEDISNAIDELQEPLVYFGPSPMPFEIKYKFPGMVVDFVGIDGQERDYTSPSKTAIQRDPKLLDIS